MSILLPRTANTTYPVALTAAYAAGMWWLYDPDYAVSKDVEFYEKARRDPVVKHGMDIRKHKVAGRSWNMETGGVTANDKALAALVEDLVKRRMHGFAKGRYRLADAVFRGSAWERMYGRREVFAAGGRPAQNYWIPTALVAIDKRRTRRRVLNGKIEMEYWPVPLDSAGSFDWRPIEHPEWHIRHSYDDDESTLGYGRGLSEGLYEYMRAKAILLVYMLQAAERFGPGLIKYKIDLEKSNLGGMSQEAFAAQAVSVLRKMRAEGIIAIPASDDFDLMEGSGTGWQMITQALFYLDNKITTLLLGSSLPTTATTGGSYAMAETQADTTEDLIQYDREILSESIDRDFVSLLLRVNAPQIKAVGLGNAARPRFVIMDEKREDPQVSATVASTLLQAGIALRRDEVLKKCGFSVPAPGDDVINPLAAVAGEGGLDDLLGRMPAAAAPGSATEAAAGQVESEPGDVASPGAPVPMAN